MPKANFPSLVQLPDDCLLAVLQCLTDEPASLFSAARAHSRLHQAAVFALSSVSATVKSQEQLDDGLLPYLAKQSQYISSISLRHAANVIYEGIVREMPPSLHLTSLQFDSMRVQLLPGTGDGVQGVLGTIRHHLKQLRLSHCVLLDGEDGLAAALSLLPGLEHLSVCDLLYYTGPYSYQCQNVCLAAEALQQLQQLTHLELAGFMLHGASTSAASGQPNSAVSGQPSAVLQPLQALTRLVDLRLSPCGHHPHNYSIDASMLSSLTPLTRLELSGQVVLKPCALASHTQLQHLNLSQCRLAGGTGGFAQLLAQLHDLQQLTHLDLARTGLWSSAGLWSSGEVIFTDDPPAAAIDGLPAAVAYSALTASSKLQHLDISRCILPAGAWQYMFPCGRQLPHLQSLNISWAKHLSGDPHSSNLESVIAPEGSCLVSCCPGLQELDIRGLDCRSELLAPLTGLSSLHTLLLFPYGRGAADDLRVVCQLTGLRQLQLAAPKEAHAEGLLQQLTQLQRLTSLGLSGYMHDEHDGLFRQGPGDEPVWRQLLQSFRTHSGTAMA